jgi:branched-chain amino acid transport system permease protein
MKLLNKKNVLSLLAVFGLYAIADLLIKTGIIDSYIFLNIVLIGINIILAVSLNLITGFTGQFSLGHAAFMSIGAYASGVLTAKLGQPFLIGITFSSSTVIRLCMSL